MPTMPNEAKAAVCACIDEDKFVRIPALVNPPVAETAVGCVDKPRAIAADVPACIAFCAAYIERTISNSSALAANTAA